MGGGKQLGGLEVAVKDEDAAESGSLRLCPSSEQTDDKQGEMEEAFSTQCYLWKT